MARQLYPSSPILLVDDETNVLTVFDTELRNSGINNTILKNDSRKVMDEIHQNSPVMVLLDLSMPHIKGEALLNQITREFPSIQVIVITGIDDAEIAVRCMKAGAFDYLVKPVEPGVLTASVKRVLRFSELNYEVMELKQRLVYGELKHPDVFSAIVTNNDTMKALFHYAEAIAVTSNPVLITGETGVGKELFAQAIHKISRRQGALITLNIAGLDDNVFSDTLFGHKKGAFTGAMENRKGIIEHASGGTVFLDEIGDISSASQVKLLRLLQQGEFLPLGSDTPRYTDARIITATNIQLSDAVENGKFRKDLYYRLISHHIEIPPLRKRLGDLPMLVDYFLDKSSHDLGREKPAIPKELFDVLKAYGFPGNVRELEAMVSDAVSVHKGGVLSTAVFRKRAGLKPGDRGTDPDNVKPAGENPFCSMIHLPTLKEADSMLTEEALKRANHNLTVASQLLGITRQALSKRMKRSAI